MKKIVIVFGLISGLVLAGMGLYAANLLYYHPEKFSRNDVLGYAALIVAFSFIFVGIKSYRDKRNQGIISFGKAFKIGLLITLIASSMYVGVWLVDYYIFIPDFLEKYIDFAIKGTIDSGASQAEINDKIKELADYREWYKNPVFVILLTYMEVFPIGLAISLISALLLKRKTSKLVPAQ